MYQNHINYPFIQKDVSVLTKEKKINNHLSSCVELIPESISEKFYGLKQEITFTSLQ